MISNLNFLDAGPGSSRLPGFETEQLPLQVCIASQPAGKARLQVPTAMYRDRKNLALPGFRVDVVTTRYPLEFPAVRLQQPAQFRSRDRLQTATSRIWMFDSGCRPCSLNTSRTPPIASRTLFTSSGIESACE